MRRLVLVVSAVFSATLLSVAALSVEAQPASSQYEPSDGSKASGDTQKSSAPSSGANIISQGSIAGDTQQALAAQQDLAAEEKRPDYSQVVDNSTRGRFSAPGWQQGSGSYSHDGDHAVARSGSDGTEATFEVRIPTSNDYAVYAWWTASKENTSAARFEIATASGPHTEKVNQTRDGGMWIKLGSFAMKGGERTIKVSPSGGSDVVADAVAVVRGEQAAPPDEEAETTAAASGATMRGSDTRARTSGMSIVRQARRYMGTRYRYGTCTRSRMSCTCLTKKAVAPRHRFSMSELGQWRYRHSARVRGKSNLRPGDILFFKENGRRGPITHVGVYSGRGNIVHASSYFGKVVESKMRYLRGYMGAKRVRTG